MKLRLFSLSVTLTVLSITTALFLSSCENEIVRSSIITEVYEVADGANEEYAKGPLKYMEHENFENDVMFEKSFYNEDQSLKGKEVYDYVKGSKLPTGSKFYDLEGVILSTYKYTYQDTLKTFSHAYAGDTDELLRIEGFQYDNKGNLVIKTIFNDAKVKQRSFMFGHDVYGNEVKMVMTDADDKEVLSETYEIVTVDERNRWIEKFGYLNDSKTPVTFYNKRRSEY